MLAEFLKELTAQAERSKTPKIVMAPGISSRVLVAMPDGKTEWQDVDAPSESTELTHFVSVSGVIEEQDGMSGCRCFVSPEAVQVVWGERWDQTATLALPRTETFEELFEGKTRKLFEMVDFLRHDLRLGGQGVQDLAALLSKVDVSTGTRTQYETKQNARESVTRSIQAEFAAEAAIPATVLVRVEVVRVPGFVVELDVACGFKLSATSPGNEQATLRPFPGQREIADEIVQEQAFVRLEKDGRTVLRGRFGTSNPLTVTTGTGVGIPGLVGRSRPIV
jgi:hypothetical protein